MTRMREARPAATRTSSLAVGPTDDRFEQEADRAADAFGRGASAPARVSAAPPPSLQRASRDASGSLAAAPPSVDHVLRTNGQPLDTDTRTLMQGRLGFDFGRVRVHADGQAAESARAVRARAYTVGHDVVFGAGEYAPQSRDGQRLIAHELMHVRQQAGARPLLQRWNVFDEIGGWFAGDDFTPKTLSTYLQQRDAEGTIEGHSDSDNKARAIVKAWKANRSAFTLTPKLKAILIKEMQSGFTGDDDELAILDVLNTATDAELTDLFTAQGLAAKSIDSDFHGHESDLLADFFSRRFEGGFAALEKGEVRVRSGAQPASAGQGVDVKAAPEPPRDDYVFIMGKDSAKAKKSNPFYTEAEKYFRVHYPNATMVTSERTLEGLLSYIDRNVEKPIGNLFVVSHGNEDGTLSFGLNDEDLKKDPAHPKSLHGDSHLSPMELKEAMHPASGKSLLPSVGAKIDKRTTIHIRGCDLGQNKEFVNLIDEAFGGKGRVVASTHEQDYGTDPKLAELARAKARKEIEASEPMPAPLDTYLADAKDKKEKNPSKAAKAARARDLRDRQTRINQKLTDKKDEIDTGAALAQAYESASGVVMQRPGKDKFPEAEVKAEIDGRYGHLSDKQRAALVKAVLKNQKVQTETFPMFTGNVPATSAQALKVFGASLRKEGFTPDRKKDVEITATKQDDGTETREYKFVATDGSWMTPSISGIPVNDANLLRDAKANSPNPQNYEWKVVRTSSGARLDITVVARRVFADLHHQSLDAKPHEHFNPGEDNPRFYVWSTFDPDADAKKAAKKK